MAATNTGDNGTALARDAGAKFRANVAGAARRLLEDWVGPDRAAEAIGRVTSALTATSMAAKNPADFFACTPQSIAQVVAISALTGIMPGTGALALAYAIPRRPRRNEPPQLQYQLSHRGICALARRAGSVVVPIPVSHRDYLDVVGGEVAELKTDIDDPPTTWDDLRGVVVLVKDLSGAVLFRGWVPKKIIAERRAMSDSFTFAEKPGNDWAQKTDPWHRWPVEQASKAGLHYAAARGWIVIDDTEAVRALSIDATADIIDVDVAAPQAEEPKALQDTGALDELDQMLAGDDPREPVLTNPEPPAEEPKRTRKPRDAGALPLVESIVQGEKVVGADSVRSARTELGIAASATAEDIAETADRAKTYIALLNAHADRELA